MHHQQWFHIPDLIDRIVDTLVGNFDYLFSNFICFAIDFETFRKQFDCFLARVDIVTFKPAISSHNDQIWRWTHRFLHEFFTFFHQEWLSIFVQLFFFSSPITTNLSTDDSVHYTVGTIRTKYTDVNEKRKCLRMFLRWDSESALLWTKKLRFVRNHDKVAPLRYICHRMWELLRKISDIFWILDFFLLCAYASRYSPNEQKSFGYFAISKTLQTSNNFIH